MADICISVPPGLEPDRVYTITSVARDGIILTWVDDFFMEGPPAYVQEYDDTDNCEG